MKITKTKRIHLAKWILAVVFVISVITIGIYPVPNQGVTVVVDAGNEIRELKFSAAEIAELNGFIFEFPNIQNLSIDEIRFRRYFKTIVVDKINPPKLKTYTEIGENQIYFNDSACEKMLKLSKSCVIERIFVSETVLAIILFLWILLNALEEKMGLESYDNHGPIHEIKRFCTDVYNYREYMIFAAKADLKAEVANSYLNRLWWLLEPLCHMMVYVIVFGGIMGKSIENYALFIFSALTMWNYFSKIISYSVKCIRNNRDIVTKIYVPKYILLLTNMVLNFLKMLFSVAVLVIMLVIFRVRINICVLWVIPTFLVMMMISFAMGMILLHFGVFIDDLSYAVGILLQMLMFLSGIFYDVNVNLAYPLNGIMMCINPVAMFIDAMRNALLYNIVTNIPLVVMWIILSLLIGYIGIHTVFKNENSYAKVI